MSLAKAIGYKNLGSIAAASVRFWSRVDKGESEECWDWSGTLMTSGYGELSFLGKKIGAHRFSYLLHVGELEAGKCICHHNFCNNRLCVNPSHLYQGTYKDNWEDTVRRLEAARVPGEAPSEGFWDFMDEDHTWSE